MASNITMSTQPDLFDVGERIEPEKVGQMATPYAIGTGPEGERCGTCAYLQRLRHNDRVYLKCGKTPNTHGAGTDIKARWPACFEWRPKKHIDESGGVREWLGDCVLLNCLMPTMSTEICEERDRNARARMKLEFADKLDEYGDGARAEMIRKMDKTSWRYEDGVPF